MDPEAYDDKEDVPNPAIEMVREILREMHSEALKGILPAEIVEELSSYCQEHSVPTEKLIPLVMKDCKNREDELLRLMGEFDKNPDDFEWSADPLDCLVIAFLHEAMRRFEEKFSDLDEPDPADWWKETQ